MSEGSVKDDAPKQLGRIMLKRRPVQAVARPRDPATRHAQLVALSERYGVPALDLDQVCLKTADLGNVPRSLAQHHLLIPVLARADRLFVAMKDPSQLDVIQEVEFVAGKRVYAYVAPAEDIAEAIERAYLARERGEEHFIGAGCPPETLRRAGLLTEGPGEAEPEGPSGLAEPAGVEATVDAAADAAAEVAAEAEVAPLLVEIGSPAPLVGQELLVGPGDAGAGPSATVSAYPKPRSSLPPALRGELEEGDEQSAEVADVQRAFDELLDDDSAISRLPTEEGFAERGPGAPKLVLVVDEDAAVCAAVEAALREDGHQVQIADNGRQALLAIKARTPDLLFMSALLPEVHGFEIAQRLRNSQRYGSLPIIMIGAMHRGWSLPEDQRESCRVEQYMEHPLEPDALRRAVLDALRGKAPEAAPAGDISREAEKALEAGMLAYRSGDVQSAIAHLERGAAMDPLAYRLHFHLGLLFAQQGQTYDAIRALERAVEINSRHFGGVKNLAIMYGQAGFRNRAAEMWQRGLALAPDDETRSAIAEHLAGLLSQDGLS
ncbi:MAG TPA: response regulator [Polyangiaceae bacterium]|nr:response regulator [Polyangiaceae bacterium]